MKQIALLFAFITIPLAVSGQGSFDSFNVGIATGIILFEASKQRMGFSS